ncbi:MAG: hypothetical protein IKP73_04175 [Bacteroidales bacterium]|jgi:hypothetical protein|nr:hypothetical protein [Bacteroidales bacterium]
MEKMFDNIIDAWKWLLSIPEGGKLRYVAAIAKYVATATVCYIIYASIF